MPIQTTYSDARARLAELIDRVVDERETVTITKRGEVAAVLMAAEEYHSLIETAHLLRSPANATRLFEALAEVARGEDVRIDLEAFLQEKGLA